MPDTAEARRAAAQELWQACEQLSGGRHGGLRDRVLDHVPVLARRRRRATSDALRQVSALKRRMRGLTVGAGQSWGVLSGGTLVGFQSEPRTIEYALDTAYRDQELPAELRRLTAHWLADLPFVRASVERDGDAAAGWVEELQAHVLTIAADRACGARLRRALLDFVPARHRPPVDDLADLDRAWGTDGPLVTLFVRWRTGTPGVIWLSDIVMNEGLRGRGLGGETLRELCEFADRRQATIAGEFIPEPPEASAAIAHWYARAGFASGQATPEQWRPGARIRRSPSV